MVDLIKINIEGGEYDLPDYIIHSGMAHCFRNIQVQFNDFVTNYKLRMQPIQQNLSITHYLTYQYPFVWENWKLKTVIL